MKLTKMDIIYYLRTFIVILFIGIQNTVDIVPMSIGKHENSVPADVQIDNSEETYKLFENSVATLVPLHFKAHDIQKKKLVNSKSENEDSQISESENEDSQIIESDETSDSSESENEDSQNSENEESRSRENDFKQRNEDENGDYSEDFNESRNCEKNKKGQCKKNSKDADSKESKHMDSLESEYESDSSHEDSDEGQSKESHYELDNSGNLNHRGHKESFDGKNEIESKEKYESSYESLDRNSIENESLDSESSDSNRAYESLDSESSDSKSREYETSGSESSKEYKYSDSKSTEDENSENKSTDYKTAEERNELFSNENKVLHFQKKYDLESGDDKKKINRISLQGKDVFTSKPLYYVNVKCENCRVRSKIIVHKSTSVRPNPQTITY